MNKKIFLLSCLVFVGFSAWGSDYHSARTMGLGGSGHAAPLLNDSIYLNPSYASFLPSYSMALNYSWFDGGAQHHGRLLNASLQDGRSELFQAGVGYTQRNDVRFVHIGASKAFLQRFGFGLGGKFIIPPGSNDLIRDATLSMSVIAANWVQMVAIVDNLFQTRAGKDRNFYRELILGTKFNMISSVLVYFDPHWVADLPAGLSRFGHESGLELTLMSDLYLRLGAFRNSSVPTQAGARGRGYATGLGWISPRISFDYGMSRIIEPMGETTHSLGMTLYF